MNHLLARVGVDAWDFLIVGDGSGSSWTRGAGWASVSVERATGERIVWTGAVNRGTVNLAEIMAYLQPLEWLASREADRLSRNPAGLRTYDVHILTDSQYCRDTGSSSGRVVRKNAGLWVAFDAFARHGFALHWHWLRRDECDLNKFCDALSRAARKLHETDLPGGVLGHADWPDAVSGINPTEEL